MKIEFSIDKLDGFLPTIARQLGLKAQQGRFEIPIQYGRGHFNQLQFNDSMLITYYDLLLNEESTIHRKKSDNASIIPIIFWLSDNGIHQEIEAESKEIGSGTPDGIFMPSNCMETTYTFPKAVPIKNITVFVTKEWLQENMVGQNDFLNKVIFSNKRFFLFEEVDYQLNSVLMTIEGTFKSDMDHTLSKIKLYAETIGLIHLFFDKLIRRSLRPINSVKPQDIKILFEVKANLVKNLSSIPSTSKLAKAGGINERKLQRLFKHVFGKSIYQYAIDMRMKEAKKLLATKAYSVAEVGYLVGYSNLSHFSDMFNKHHKIRPKIFLKSLIR